MWRSIKKVTANEIADAMEKAIKLVEELFNDLIALETEMKIYEKDFKMITALSTTLNVAATGLSVGCVVFTGGLSLIVETAALQAAGAATSELIENIDNIKSNNCLKEIIQILEKFDDEINSLQKMLKIFNYQVEGTMKSRQIDRTTAFLFELGVDNGKSNCMDYTVIMKTCSKFLIEYLDSFTFTKEQKGLITIGSGTCVVLGMIRIFCEISNLVKILFNDHPSIQQIRAAKTELQKQKTILTENLNQFKCLHKTVFALHIAAHEKAEEIFSLMFGKVMKKPLPVAEPMSFDHYVNQIGTGREGGIYELIFLAEMIGQTIEIHDRTENKIISALHGKDKISVIPFTMRSSEVITLILTNENGINHYSPSSTSGTLKSVFNISTYDNRCLFDAIAEYLCVSTNTLITRLQKFLREHPEAKDVYDSNIEEVYPEFIGGRKAGDPTKRTRFNRRCTTGAEEIVTATVRFENINEGSDVTAKIREKMQTIGHRTDDSGHIIAYCLGGTGNDEENFVPIIKSLNRGQMAMIEKEIKNILTANQTWYAEITVILSFDPKAEKNLRPIKVRYQVKFYNEDGDVQKMEHAKKHDKTFDN